jgi:hypothetical protein
VPRASGTKWDRLADSSLRRQRPVRRLAAAGREELSQAREPTGVGVNRRGGWRRERNERGVCPRVT